MGDAPCTLQCRLRACIRHTTVLHRTGASTGCRGTSASPEHGAECCRHGHGGLLEPRAGSRGPSGPEHPAARSPMGAHWVGGQKLVFSLLVASCLWPKGLRCGARREGEDPHHLRCNPSVQGCNSPLKHCFGGRILSFEEADFYFLGEQKPPVQLCCSQALNPQPAPHPSAPI